MYFRFLVWYSPVLVMGSHYWVWFWRSRVTAYHRHSTCASPAMHASQGIIRVFFRVLLVGLVFWAGCSKSSEKVAIVRIILYTYPITRSFYFNNFIIIARIYSIAIVDTSQGRPSR